MKLLLQPSPGQMHEDSHVNKAADSRRTKTVRARGKREEGGDDVVHDGAVACVMRVKGVVCMSDAA